MCVCFVYMHLFLCIMFMPSAQEGQKGALEPLEFQTGVSCHVIAGNWTWVHARAASALSCPAVSLLFDAFSRPARKNTTDQNLLRQSFILTSSGKQSKKQEREKTKTPSLLRSILLRLGRVTPWLAAAHRPSWRHGEGRAQVVIRYPWHMRRLFVYHLEHRMSAPSCNGECGGGSQQNPTIYHRFHR